MIYTIEILSQKFNTYSNIYEKIKTEEKNNRLIKIKRGLYTDNVNNDNYFIANVLYRPSYISFETALSFYDLFPERVNVIKSATFNKNRTKIYQNKTGVYLYEDVNKNAYPYGVETININDQLIQFASKEKALTDTISKISPRNSLKEIKDLLFDDLRINEYEFDLLDKELMIKLCDLYHNTSLKYLKKYLLINK